MTYNEFIQNILDTRGRFSCGDEYHERHHILPKCMGGTNNEENLIDLYAKEHYEAHRLLALENPHNNKLVYAWNMMSYCIGSENNDRLYSTADDYELLKKMLSKAVSENLKGKEFSEEHRNKISESLKGRVFSEETRQKMRDNHADFSNGKHPMYGKHHTEESRKNMSNGQQNRNEQWREKQSLAHKGKKKHSEEWKKELSEKMSGTNNPNYGRKKTKEEIDKWVDSYSKKIKCQCEGIIFRSISDCARYYNIKIPTMYSWVRGNNNMPKEWMDKGLKLVIEYANE